METPLRYKWITTVTLPPHVNLFICLLLYSASTYTAIKDVRKNQLPSRHRLNDIFRAQRMKWRCPARIINSRYWNLDTETYLEVASSAVPVLNLTSAMLGNVLSSPALNTMLSRLPAISDTLSHTTMVSPSFKLFFAIYIVCCSCVDGIRLNGGGFAIPLPPCATTYDSM